MEGVTGFATRLWYSLTSAPPVAATPFLRVTPTFPIERISTFYAPELHRLKKLVNFTLIPQVMTPDADDFIRIAEFLLLHTDFVDLNCGCPSPTVVGGGAGSSLLKKPGEFGRFIEKITAALGPGRVSVKMRVGFSNSSEFSELLPTLRGVPLAQLTVHGRTRDERYSGASRWDLINQASKILVCPIIGSGDIVDSHTMGQRLAAASQVKGVIIGRGALRNPWIFEELRQSRPQSISIASLVTSLAVFTVLQHAFHEAPAALFEMAEQGLFLNSPPKNEEEWNKILLTATKATYGCPLKPGEIVVPPQILSRTKMIWNHLRSSLPAPFFDGMILRCTSFSELVVAIARKAHASPGGGSPHLPLTYNPNHDWIYSGTRKPQ